MKYEVIFGLNRLLFGIIWDVVILDKDKYHVFCIHIPTVCLIITWTEIMVDASRYQHYL
jgi:hypothetical protein